MKFALDNAQKGMQSLMPALALMAPAFWVAWIELIYSGEIGIGGATATSLEIIQNYAISTTAMGGMLVLYGFIPRKIEQLLTRDWVVPAAGLLASLVTLWGMVAPSPVPTFLTGIFTSMLVARFAVVFAHVNPKASLLSIILSQMVASFVYGYVLALPSEWQPLLMCLLPFIAGCCAMFNGDPLRSDSLDSDKSLTPGFVRFVVAIVLFSIALNVVRGYYPLSVEMDQFSDARGNSSVLFFFVKMAFALFVLMLPLKANLGKLCYYGFVALAIFTLPLPLLGLQNPATLETFGCINAMLNIVVWSLFAGISYKSGRSPVRMMGWGWGFMSLGSVAGWLLGSGIFNLGLGAEYMAGFEVALIAVMLLSCMFVCTWGVVDGMFDPFDKDSDGVPVDRSLAERDELHLAELPTPAALEACAYCEVCAKGGEGVQVSFPGMEIPVAGGAAGGVAAGGGDAADVEPGQGAGDGGVVDVAPRAAGRWKSAAFEMSEAKGLSQRESEVLQLLLKGHSKQRVAEELFVSYNTVRSHVRKVYVKCDAHSQQELIDLFERDYLRK